MSDRRSPVVFFANGIGDAILALPALRALARHFDGRSRLVSTPRAIDFCLGRLDFAEVIACPMRLAGESREFDAGAVAARLGGTNLLVAAVPWRSRSLDALREELRPKRTVGFFPDHDLHVPRDFGKHTADLSFDLARALDPALRFEDFAAPPRFARAAEDRARAIRAMLPAGARVLAVHNETISKKIWPLDRLARTLAAFLAPRPDWWAFLLSTGEQSLPATAVDDRIVPCRSLALPIAASLVAQADLFLGVDSCMLHVADFHRVPGVAIFGPTDPHEFGFRLAPHVHLRCGRTTDGVSIDESTAALDRLAAQVETNRDDARAAAKP